MQFNAQPRKIPTHSSVESICSSEEPKIYLFSSFLEKNVFYFLLKRIQSLCIYRRKEKEGMMLFKFSRDAQRAVVSLRLATTDIWKSKGGNGDKRRELKAEKRHQWPAKEEQSQNPSTTETPEAPTTPLLLSACAYH